MTASVIIKPERERPVVQQHPWVFSGAVQEVQGRPNPGDIVDVRAHTGKFLARGYYNPKSQIVVRSLTWHEEEIHDGWWRRMIQRAIDARSAFRVLNPLTAAYRLVNAENDYIPGLIVDVYGDYTAEPAPKNWLVVQALTLGIELRKTMIVQQLADLTQPAGIFERSDVEARSKEGLGHLKGLLWGEEPPELINTLEDDYGFLVDVRRGQKTGYYLDQRPNRMLLSELLMPYAHQPCRILNLFSYTGGFGLRALIGDPNRHVVNVDSAREALELAEKTALYHSIDLERVEFIQADVFEYLRDMRDNREQFDVVILDPPKFASSMGQVERAARGYKDINLNAFHVVKPGGYLMTFSCSGAVSADLFQKIVFGALADSGRQAQILRHLGPGDDHPVALTFPEGAYLKGLLLRVY